MTDLLETVRSAIRRNGMALDDDELLGRFIERHDEAALATLVRRHGPMVWGVCRRLLAHHDAEDAFQATFIVLVRKAASIEPRAMVANWLYGVAHQTALHARRTVSRRRTREMQVDQMPDTKAEVVQEEQWANVQPVLDEELSRLPDIYRVVLVMCDLEGQTRREVARQLGVPDGTVGGRLARARALLAKRLTRRGIVLSSGTVAGVLLEGSASAAASPSLVASTIKVANLLAAGRATGVVSIEVAALAEGVEKTMFVSKIKSVLAAVLVVVALGGVTSLVRWTQAGEEPSPQKSPDEKMGKQAKSDEEQFQGVWICVEMDLEGVKKRRIEKEDRRMTLIVRQGTLNLEESDANGKLDAEQFFLYKLDPSAAVKRIDLADWKKGFEERSRIKGIYSIDGDTLTICFAEDAFEEQSQGVLNNRPTSLEPKEDSKTQAYTFKRYDKIK